jgi:hypothetical protein
MAIELDVSVPIYDYIIPGGANMEDHLHYNQGAVGRQATW